MTLGKSIAVALFAIGTSAAYPVHNAQAAGADLDCKLKFSLTSWSVIFKHSEGTGVVTCENGATMNVNITAKGGGLTVGKSHIDNGTGKFTDVHNIDEVLGSYAQGTLHAGVVKSGTAQLLTKGTVSLALAGGGEGINLGVDVGKFTIERAD